MNFSLLKSWSKFFIINAEHVDELIMKWGEVLKIEPKSIHGHFFEMVGGIVGFKSFG